MMQTKGGGIMAPPSKIDLLL